MQKCSLCGGRVVNGRCEDCGLPIPPERDYTRRGERTHTHEVNGEKILHRERADDDARRYAPRDEGEPDDAPARQSGGGDFGGASPRQGRRSAPVRNGKRKAGGVGLFLFWAFVLLQILRLFFT